MLLQINSRFRRLSVKTAKIMAFLILPLMLSGCLSHWFLESSSRLQVENATEEFSIVGIDVLGNDGSVRHWIKETVLPGERSRVEEQDLVGDFTLRVKYTRSKDGSGKILKDDQPFELEGGSLYMTVTSEDDSLVYKFK
ncbi:MAG: hypothetical protein MJY98_00775 [Fibrobacter sp.]|nr:hypothetical protein [Fibrobacter sp.]